MQAVIQDGKTRLVALLTSAVLAIGLAAAPAASGHQQGLVNVNIENVANDNEVAVTVPINAAANICGVTVAVLSGATGTFTDCDARGNQTVTVDL